MPAPEPTVVTPAVLRDWRLPAPGEDKEGRGRTLIVGGSALTPGAVVLAAEAALRCGAGKLQVATAASVAPHVALALPEALVRPLPEDEDGAISPDAAPVVVEMAEGCSAVLLGPGLLGDDAAAGLLRGTAPNLQSRVVLDALALAFLTAEPDGLHHLDGQAVLTPNLSELALTLDRGEDEVRQDPREAALALAERCRCVVSAGGPTTFIATPAGESWAVQAGGPGLGVSGSGDVQAGLVAGLCARGATPAQAGVWAAHLHGRAGDRLAATVGRLGFLARELPREVPAVLAELEV